MDVRILNDDQALEVFEPNGELRCTIPSRIRDSHAWNALHRELLQHGKHWLIVPVDDGWAQQVIDVNAQGGWVFLYVRADEGFGVYGEGLSVDVLAELFPEHHGQN